MDPIIRKRMCRKIKVYPLVGMSMGDRQFGEPYEVEAYITHREKALQGHDGSKWVLYTILYIDVSHITDDDLVHINKMYLDGAFYDCHIEKLSLSNGIALGKASGHNYGDCDGRQPLYGITLNPGVHLSDDEHINCEEKRGQFHVTTSKLNGMFQVGDGKVIQLADIKTEDEVEIPHLGRVPVQTRRIYQGLKKDNEIMEVLV